MVKNIIINNIDKCNAEVMYKTLELQTINFLKNKNALNDEKCKCAKSKVKENLQFCIINPKSIKSGQKGSDN